MPPRLGLLVDDPPQAVVEHVALGEQVVELSPAEHGAQRRLGDLGGGHRVLLDLGDGPCRVGDPEVRHGVDPGRHVVAGDDLLRRDGHRDGTQVDPLHPVDEGNQESRPERSGTSIS